LMFVAPHKHGAFRWPIERVSMTRDGELVAALGARIP
jgi:hypothetical protein